MAEVTLQELVECLRLPLASLEDILRAPSESEAFGVWQRLVQETRRTYRSVAFETHPDRGGDGSQFLTLQRAWDVFSDERFPRTFRERLRPKPRQRVTVTVTQGSSPFSQYGATSGTSTSTTDSVFGSFYSNPFSTRR